MFINTQPYGTKFQPVTFAIIICLVCNYYQGFSQDHTLEITDRNGNIYPVKKLKDDKIWMTANLNINVPGSYCYENLEQHCNKYGRLYTWQSAQEGCRLLGEGWHVSTNDEWQQMAKFYGGIRDDSQDSGRAAYKALLYGGYAGFNAIMGGGRTPGNGGYTRLDAHGFYWTATETDAATAWFYNFGKGGRMLNRHNDGEKDRALSVRCTRDKDNLPAQQ